MQVLTTSHGCSDAAVEVCNQSKCDYHQSCAHHGRSLHSPHSMQFVTILAAAHKLMHPQPSAQTTILPSWRHVPTSSLQEAAGYFRLLHDVVAPQLDEVLSFDISTGCTEMLELLMLAQAQEAFFQKASRDKKNPAVLARYAHPHIVQPSKHGVLKTATKHGRIMLL